MYQLLLLFQKCIYLLIQNVQVTIPVMQFWKYENDEDVFWGSLNIQHVYYQRWVFYMIIGKTLDFQRELVQR